MQLIMHLICNSENTQISIATTILNAYFLLQRMFLFGHFKTLSVKTQVLTTKMGLNIVLITVNIQNTPDIQGPFTSGHFMRFL